MAMSDSLELAPIQVGSCYPLSEFSRRTGMGPAALRSARKQGLKVRKIGNRKYVRGADFDAFLSAALIAR